MIEHVDGRVREQVDIRPDSFLPDFGHESIASLIIENVESLPTGARVPFLCHCPWKCGGRCCGGEGDPSCKAGFREHGPDVSRIDVAVSVKTPGIPDVTCNVRRSGQDSILSLPR